MSLFGILGNAAAALANAQAQINTVSQNVSNAQSPTYVNRSTVLVDSAPGSGAPRVVDVSRAVDASAQQDLLKQTTTQGQKDFVNQIYQQLEQLSGASASKPLLSDAVNQFTAAFKTYQAQPEDKAAQANVIATAQNLTQTVQNFASSVDALANSVQTQTQQDVNTLNKNLTAIDALNKQIISAKVSRQPTADFEDQRDVLIASVAALIPIKTSPQQDGSIQLATPDGIGLVDVTAHQFTFNPGIPNVPGTPGTNASLSLTNVPPGTGPIFTFSGGKIGAELDSLRVDAASTASSVPSLAPFEKLRQQLNSFADQFYLAPPAPPAVATPTPFQAAYDNANPVNPGELAASFFIINNQGTTGADRFNFVVNPALLNGTATIKQSAATAVVSALTQSTQPTSFSAGNITTNGSLLQIANTISSDQTLRAQQALNDSTAADTHFNATQSLYRSRTGVSVDNELAKLVVLQNSYNASAKVISIVNELFATLSAAVSAQ